VFFYFVDLPIDLFTSFAVVFLFCFSDNDAQLMHFGDAAASYGEVLCVVVRLTCSFL
jgi:hypothetical protein